MADGNVAIDVDQQFRKEGSLVVNVACRRVWLLRFRLKAFRLGARILGFLTRLRVVDIVVEVDDAEV